MGQVFGETNERQAAAEKLQRLRQTGPVTNYITEFQVITSSLDWDDEALEDKYLEGLKPEIRRALIYYPTEPEDLEELFERTQKIDKEIEGQRRYPSERGTYGYPRKRYFEKKPMYQTDRDGDIKMKGAKVNMEKARKEGLCYNCGIAGHQARNCRKPKQEKRNDQRPNTKIRMLRSGYVASRDQEGIEPNNPNETDQASTGVTQMLTGLSLDDFATEPSDGEESDGMLEDENQALETRTRDVTTSTAPNRTIVRGYRGRYRPLARRANMTSRVPGGQPDEGEQHRRIQVDTPVPEGKEQDDSEDLLLCLVSAVGMISGFGAE